MNRSPIVLVGRIQILNQPILALFSPWGFAYKLAFGRRFEQDDKLLGEKTYERYALLAQHKQAPPEGGAW